jgi:hypothetical protein
VVNAYAKVVVAAATRTVKSIRKSSVLVMKAHPTPVMAAIIE